MAHAAFVVAQNVANADAIDLETARNACIARRDYCGFTDDTGTSAAALGTGN